MKFISIKVYFILVGILTLGFLSVATLTYADDAELLWEDRFDLSGGYDAAQAVVVQGRRLFAFGAGLMPSANSMEDFDWILRAYDRFSGDLLWQDTVDGGEDLGEQACAIAVRGRYLVAVGAAGGDGDWDYRVRTYNSRTGRLLWEDHVVDPSGSELAADLVIKGNRVFVIGSHLKAYNLKHGHVLWEDFDTGNRAISIRGKRLFTAGSRDRYFFVRAHNSWTGAILWEDQVDISGGPDSAIDLESFGNRVVAVGYAGWATDRDFVVRAYNTRTGNLIWENRFDSGGYDQATAVAINRNNVYVVGSVSPGEGVELDIAVRVYDRRTGILQWDDTFDFEGSSDSASAVDVSHGRVFVGGILQESNWGNRGFVIRAYDSWTGELEWMDHHVEPMVPYIYGIKAICREVYVVGTGFFMDFFVRAYRAY